MEIVGDDNSGTHREVRVEYLGLVNLLSCWCVCVSCEEGKDVVLLKSKSDEGEEGG